MLIITNERMPDLEKSTIRISGMNTYTNNKKQIAPVRAYDMFQNIFDTYKKRQETLL